MGGGMGQSRRSASSECVRESGRDVFKDKRLRRRRRTLESVKRGELY